MQNIGRAPTKASPKGRSAVASASYRSGENLQRDETGEVFRFKRQDRVAHTEIICPDDAPEWCSDRGKLWNSVEANETRSNSRLAREFEMALPHELDLEQQKELIRAWVKNELTPLGIIADVAIHIRPEEGERNDHVHIMSSPRAMEADGNWSSHKDRGLNTSEQLERWRESWAKHANFALERAGQEARIDHRSNEDRGLAELPTVHIGYKHQAIAAKGGHSWRIEKNKEIRRTNVTILARIQARVKAQFVEIRNRLRGPKSTEAKTSPEDVMPFDPGMMTMRPDKIGPTGKPLTPTPEPKKPATIIDQEAEKRRLEQLADALERWTTPLPPKAIKPPTPKPPEIEPEADLVAAMAEAEKRKKDAHSAALAAAIAASHHR